MNDEFTPPIKERTTKELLKIVGAPKKWNTNAVKLANDELIKRKVDPKKIKTAKYLSKKRDKVKKQIKANEGYYIFDFIFDPFYKLFELTLSWELKKAKQQKYLTELIELVEIKKTTTVPTAPFSFRDIPLR